MAAAPSRSPFAAQASMSNKSRTVPLLSARDPAQGDPMEIIPVTSAPMATTHAQSPPDTEQRGQSGNANGASKGASSQGPQANQPTGAAAAAQQPKVVQTAFIHKLYR